MLVLLAAEITMFDDVIVVYKFVSDLMFFVTGSQDENELILATVLQGFFESISLLLRWEQVCVVLCTVPAWYQALRTRACIQRCSGEEDSA